jgi:hypothetical protein
MGQRRSFHNKITTKWSTMDLFSCYFIVEAPALTYNTVIAIK